MSESKRCTKCLTVKPLTEYYARKEAPSKKMSACRSCRVKTTLAWRSSERGRQSSVKAAAEWRRKNREASRAASRKWAAENLENRRNYRFLKDYGVSRSEVADYLLSVGGRCEICQHEIHLGGRSKWRACVDHCHETGDVRGVLCSNCNSAIGLFANNPDLLISGSRYLLTKKTNPYRAARTLAAMRSA